MAQLNIYTYLSQSTWLVIIYIIYYIYLKQIVLTRILEKRRIINKYRNLLSIKSNTQSDNNKKNYLNFLNNS